MQNIQLTLDVVEHEEWNTDGEDHVHFMLDVECLSTACPAVISEFSIVPFKVLLKGEHTQIKVLNQFLRKYTPNMQEQMNKGAQVDLNCLAWWLRQEDAPRLELAQSMDMWGKGHCLVPLREVMTQAYNAFRDALIDKDDTSKHTVWAKPAAFDFMLMEQLFRMADIGDPPWFHRAKMCMRTFMHGYETPQHVQEYVKRNATAHTSYDDCIMQIKQLAYVMRLRSNEWKVL